MNIKDLKAFYLQKNNIKVQFNYLQFTVNYLNK